LAVASAAAVVFAAFVLLDVDLLALNVLHNFSDDLHVLNCRSSYSNSVGTAEKQDTFELDVVSDAHVTEVNVQLVAFAYAVLARSVFENGVHLDLLLGSWFIRHQRGHIMRAGRLTFQSIVGIVLTGFE